MRKKIIRFLEKIIEHLERLDFEKFNQKKSDLKNLTFKEMNLKKLNFKAFQLKKIALKSLDFKKLPLNLTPQKFKFWGLLTVGCLLMGLFFGQILNVILPDKQPESINVSAFVEAEAKEEMGTIYVIYLGTYETFDEVLAVEGNIRKLGYGIGIHLEEDEYIVFSHLAGTRDDLESVEETLVQNEIEHTIQQIEVPSEDMIWSYFLKAVHQISFEMESDFIQEFDQDEMFIWGYYVALSNDSLETLSLERQQMLREMYQWLNSRE